MEIAEREKISEIIKKHNKLLNSILETLIKENVCKRTFYEKLWDSIKNMPLCDDESEKAGILYMLCRNELLPYYWIDGIAEIGEEERWDLINENKEYIIAARSMIKQYAICEDRTRYAAMLLKLLEQCSGEKDKVIIVSYMIKFVEVNALGAMKRQLIENINEKR